MSDDEIKKLQFERSNALALAGTATQLWEKLATENGALKRRVAELEQALALRPAPAAKPQPAFDHAPDTNKN